MKVSVITKPLTDGKRQSIFLSWGKVVRHPVTGVGTRRISIDAWEWISPKTAIEKAHNKDVRSHVALKQAEIASSLMKGDLSFLGVRTHEGSVEQYYREYCERLGNASTRRMYLSLLTHMRKYDKKGTRLVDVSIEWLSGFQQYLRSTASDNSVRTRMLYIKAALNDAYRKGYIEKRVTDFVKPLKATKVHREWITRDEADRLANTPCRDSVIKRAFLFSCYTGIRSVDVCDIVSKNTQDIHGITHLKYLNHKSKAWVQSPISVKAVRFFDKSIDDNDPQFPGLKRRLRVKGKDVFSEWVMAAAITKKITFHCSRHTFAVWALENSDLYTVSEMMGHSSITTTSIYLHSNKANHLKLATSL